MCQIDVRRNFFNAASLVRHVREIMPLSAIRTGGCHRIAIISAMKFEEKQRCIIVLAVCTSN
jgi:hypothetical protein